VLWVEGEPGIGKSSLVAEALAGSDPAWDVGWGMADQLTERLPLIRQALYERMPLALRTALHAEAARELATAGADTLSVAQQLSAAGQPGAGWAVRWLLQSASALTARAPQLAAELLRRELGLGQRGEDDVQAAVERAAQLEDRDV
jgi:hypothetical protein